MAVVRPISDPEAFDAWVQARPPCIQEMIRALPIDRLYRLGPNRVTLYSFCEDGTVTVDVTGEFNRVLFSRRVFGVDPKDLVECELPEPGEDLGDTSLEAGYTEPDIREILIPLIREKDSH